MGTSKVQGKWGPHGPMTARGDGRETGGGPIINFSTLELSPKEVGNFETQRPSSSRGVQGDANSKYKIPTKKK